MNTTALLFMIITEVIITGFTLYFFIKVLFIKPKANDSYSNNDETKVKKTN